MNERIITDSRLIKTPAREIFAVLADPSQHRDIDGSGMVRRHHESAPSRLTLGSQFEMHMSQSGGPYRIINEVVEFDEPTLIAWEVHPGRRFRRLRDHFFGGHRWRYRLTETDEGTVVEEQWDYSTCGSVVMLKLLRFPARNAVAIRRTLDQLERRFATGS